MVINKMNGKILDKNNNIKNIDPKEKNNKRDIILSIKNASYKYNDAEENDYALRNISYDFEKGKLYAIRGRSGSGKTTLLSLISGLERCTEGQIIFDGKDLKDIDLDKYRNSEIGIVFQSYIYYLL